MGWVPGNGSHGMGPRGWDPGMGPGDGTQGMGPRGWDPGMGPRDGTQGSIKVGLLKSRPP